MESSVFSLTCYHFNIDLQQNSSFTVVVVVVVFLLKTCLLSSDTSWFTCRLPPPLSKWSVAWCLSIFVYIHLSPCLWRLNLQTHFLETTSVFCLYSFPLSYYIGFFFRGGNFWINESPLVLVCGVFPTFSLNFFF